MALDLGGFCVTSVLVHCEAKHSDGACVEEPSGSPHGGWEVIRDKRSALSRHGLSGSSFSQPKLPTAYSVRSLSMN